MIWRNSWAWTGLLFLALPVLIHLLSRAPAGVRPFPSLRFIDPSRLLPRRRTRPRDVLLLLVRLGIIAAAVAALAGPVFLTAPRAGTPRVVRAIVLDTSASMRRPLSATALIGATTGASAGTTGNAGISPGALTRGLLDSATSLASGASAGAAVHTLVRTADLHAGIRGASGWLAAHSGIRELVVISDFQRGSIDSSLLRDVPPRYGLRLVRLDGTPQPDTFSTSTHGGVATVASVRALADRTEMSWVGATASFANAVPRVQLRVPAGSRARAIAAYAAAMDASGVSGEGGVPGADGASWLEHVVPASDAFTATDARVQIVYPGAVRETTGRRRFDAGVGPLRAAWMADVVVRIAADPLLRDVVRDATPTAAARTNISTHDTSRFVVVATRAGEPLVHAVQDSTAGTTRLLLFCLAEPGSAVSAALIAATFRVLEAAAPYSLGDGARATAAAAVHDIAEREPMMMTDAELAPWNRAAGDSIAAMASVLTAADPEQVGESDARWFWALVLLLLVVEASVRRIGTIAETTAGTTAGTAAGTTTAASTGAVA